MKKNINFYKKAMKSNEILEDIVVLTQYDKEIDSDIIAMDLGGMRGVVKREDLDYQRDWNSLVGFIGTKINFIIEKIDEENKIIYCSRKKAQEMVEDDIIDSLESGKELEATITGVVRYGAYVEINGIYGLLQNSDFSDDYIKIKDVMNIGDKIKVKLKNISQNNKITLLPAEKYVLKAVLKFDNFERNQVVLGTVNTIKPWGVFVQISKGLDALCPIPETEEIEEGVQVSFRITNVKKEEGRVRGKILRVIQ